jgi:hypothetical protein
MHIYRYVLVASNNNDKKANRTNVIIYDLRNKHICLSTILPIGEDVVRVLRDGSIAYVFTSAGTYIEFILRMLLLFAFMYVFICMYVF